MAAVLYWHNGRRCLHDCHSLRCPPANRNERAPLSPPRSTPTTRNAHSTPNPRTARASRGRQMPNTGRGVRTLCWSTSPQNKHTHFHWFDSISVFTHTSPRTREAKKDDRHKLLPQRGRRLAELQSVQNSKAHALQSLSIHGGEGEADGTGWCTLSSRSTCCWQVMTAVATRAQTWLQPVWAWTQVKTYAGPLVKLSSTLGSNSRAHIHSHTSSQVHAWTAGTLVVRRAGLAELPSWHMLHWPAITAVGTECLTSSWRHPSPPPQARP